MGIKTGSTATSEHRSCPRVWQLFSELNRCSHSLSSTAAVILWAQPLQLFSELNRCSCSLSSTAAVVLWAQPLQLFSELNRSIYSLSSTAAFILWAQPLHLFSELNRCIYSLSSTAAVILWAQPLQLFSELNRCSYSLSSTAAFILWAQPLHLFSELNRCIYSLSSTAAFILWAQPLQPHSVVGSVDPVGRIQSAGLVPSEHCLSDLPIFVFSPLSQGHVPFLSQFRFVFYLFYRGRIALMRPLHTSWLRASTAHCRVTLSSHKHVTKCSK
jgi:hypothetical protein